jgi:hypothetical protein
LATPIQWAGENALRFAATWIVVGGVTAGVVSIVGDEIDLPDSLADLLSAPFSLLALLLLVAIAAAVGLLLLSPVVAPFLAMYLLALWWVGRLTGGRWARALAVGLSPLLTVPIVADGELDSFAAAFVVGSLAYGFVVRPPPRVVRPVLSIG